VNAIALSADGVLTDPFRGASDLKRKIIRCVGEAEIRFREDALRMLRAVRFSAQLGFSIEEKTAAAIAACASLAARLSAERVRDEIEKTLCSPRPELSSEFLSRGLLISRLDDSSFSPGDFSRLRSLRTTPLLRWAGFGSLLRTGGRAIRPSGLFHAGCVWMGKQSAPALRQFPFFAAAFPLTPRDGGLPCLVTGFRPAALPRPWPPRAATIPSSKPCPSVLERRGVFFPVGPCRARRGSSPARLFRPAVGESNEPASASCHRHPEDNEREKLLALVRGYRAGDSETGTSRD
jgi:hypothetical protein